MEPYYPVNDEKNGKLFAAYKELAEKEEHVIFGGRLGNYQYYDMDKVVEAALLKLEERCVERCKCFENGTDGRWRRNKMGIVAKKHEK